MRTELMDEPGIDPSMMMPLNSYVAETMTLLQTQDTEIVVERVKPHWLAARSETYDQYYAAYNVAQ